MKTFAHIWAAAGICVAYIHYHVFKSLVLDEVFCNISSEPCSVSAFHHTLIDVLGFPLWHLPSALFAKLPGVRDEGIEPLEVQAALNGVLWGLLAFAILQGLSSYLRRSR